MTKPSGTADEILNLPSGGGSVAGSGGNFNVDLNTGTAAASFDLMVPAGPNGVMPPLKLQYSAGAGDGAFGLGWSLGIVEIRAKVTPSADPPDPTAVGYYSIVGVGDLVDMGAGRFRPTVDNSGQLIVFANGAWSLTDRNDTTCTLGSSTASRIGGASPVAWLTDRCTDSSGNAIVYTWIADGGGLLPGTITWGTYQIVFQYEARPDVVIDGSYGAPITLDKRCNAIELHVTTEQQSLVRSWTLLYNDNAGLGRSLLATIREQGHAADGSVLAAPDRSFAYSAPGPAKLMPVTGWTSSLSDIDTELVDLNGDGLPDILRVGSGLPMLHPNLGGAKFGPPQTLSRTPAPFRLSSVNVAFADMSGGGDADLLVLSQPLSGYYPLSAPGGSGPPTFGLPVVFNQAPRVVLTDPHVRLLDLNGDGLTDILFDTGRGWLMYFREAANTWSDFPRVAPPARTPPVSLSDSHVYLADMTGDGLTDIVHVDGGGVTYWPARADGGWDAAIRMSPSPAFSRDYDPRRLTLADLDGDGCADLIYVGASSVTVWRNVGAGRLTQPIVVADTPFASPGTYRIVDLLGSGTVGVHFQLPMVRAGQSRQMFLDLTGGIKPYLLTDMVNGPFQSTHITYRTSTSYAQDDAAAGSPWQTYHPFPVQCVARTDLTDHGTSVTTSVQYTYHDGRYDPDTRVFLGFGRVESDQLGDAAGPTMRVQTVFHLGLDPADPARPLFGNEALQLGALRKKPLSVTVYGLDGSPLQANPYSVTLHTYNTLLVPSGLSNGAQVAVPYVATTTEQRWERQAAMLSTREIQYLAINTEGDVTLQRTTAQRTGVTTLDQDVTTATTFATGGKNIRLPARITQTGPGGAVISATVTYYDGDAFQGLPEGEATLGLVTRIENLAFDNAFATSVWGAAVPDLTVYGYHRQAGDSTGWWITRRAHQRTSTPGGPVLITAGPLGGLQHLQFDAAGQRVVGVTDAVGNTLTAVVNPRVWQTESLTDANGRTTTDQFDTLGRVTATIGPLDSAALPWMTFAYTAAAISSIGYTARVTHGGTEVVPSQNWIDGSGRVMGKGTPGAVAGQSVISNAVAYNTRGLTTATYLPYAVSGTGWQPPPDGTSAATFVYDALGRVIRHTRPDGLVVQTRNDTANVVLSETWPGGTSLDIERHILDAAGQLISVSRNAGDHWVEQTYTYAPSGKISSVTLPGGGQVLIAYDLLGRRFGHQSADTGRTVYLIDACGNERLRTNSTGQTVRTEVDASNRTTAVYHDTETTPRIAYAYLDAGGAVPADGITANRYARMWRVTDEIGTITQQYDEMGRVTATQRTVASNAQVLLNEASYDALGRMTAITLPATGGAAARTVQYGYRPDGRITTASGVVTQAAYDILGRMTSIAYANGASTTIDYRPNSSGIQRVRVTDASGALLRDITVAQADGMITGLASATVDDDSVSYAYDGLRRLAAADYQQGAAAAEAYTWAYDDSFAVTAVSGIGALTYKVGTHQLASVAGEATVFDAAGRLTTARYGSMVFDAADHLSSLTLPGGNVISHTYDYRGLRARTITGGQETYSRPCDNVESQSGSAVVWIPFGNQRLAADIDGALYCLHPNALGGMDLVTDATGHEAGRARQNPFGGTRPASATPATGSAPVLVLLIIGADASGLICQGRRWYDPQTAQFISPDPVVTGAYIIGAWNPYLYCLGNPIALTDPSGCSFLSILAAIGVAIVCAVCVVAAVFTCGATIFGVAAMLDAYFGLMVGVAVGSFGGALAGGLAAQKAGGNIWAGAFLGGLLGGTCALVGGVLGAAAAYSINCAFGAENTLLSFVASGAIQGTLAGAGTGLGAGFAGGKGSVDSALLAMVKGAAWGASLGAFLGLGIGGMVGTGLTGTTQPSQFLNFFNFGSKFADESSLGASINSADNVMGVAQTGEVLAAPGGFTAGNVIQGIIPNLMTTDTTQFSVQLFGTTIPLGIPLSGVAGAMLYDAGFAGAIDASMVTDQLGVSYAWQVVIMFGAAPYFIDFAVAQSQIIDPNGFNNLQTGFNQAFGSSNPNNIDSN